MEEGTLYNQPVVLDNGLGRLKAGFAGEDKPRVHLPAYVGRPKYQRVMAGHTSATDEGIFRHNNSEAYVGSAAQQHRGLLRLRYPVEHGVVTDWDDMERLWQYTFSAGLKAAPEDHPLLITEAPLNPRANRDRMCELLFEGFSVPCAYVLVQAVLALYALGRTTGVVLDSGDGVSHVVPVYEGFLLPPAVRRMDLAGRDVLEHLAYQIRRMLGLHLGLSAELDVAREIKERCCFVLASPAADEDAFAAVPYSRYLPMGPGLPLQPEQDGFRQYRLPDGHTLNLGVERFRAPEILFNPQIVGEESPGLGELTSLAIAKADLDLRAELYQNVVLSGGTTLTPGFGDRLLAELKQHQHGGVAADRLKIKIYAPPERQVLTWIGGSILGGLSTFRKMWVTAKEYTEDPNIVHRKCM